MKPPSHPAWVAFSPGLGASLRSPRSPARNNSDTVKTGRFDLNAGPATVEAFFLETVMMYARVQVAAAGPNAWVNLGAAIAPNKLRPSVPRPSDFDAFWDGKTIVVTGASMCGQRSLVIAGLNPKVTAVVVNEPSGADFNGTLHGRRSGYPFWPASDARAMAAGPYFNTVNFASRIKAPARVAVGFIDTTAPPVGIIIAFNQVPGAKELIPMIDSDHNHITPQRMGPWNARSKEILGLTRGGGTWVTMAGAPW